MTKLSAFIIGAVVGSAGVVLLTTTERSEIKRLRFDLESLRQQRIQLPSQADENARLSSLVAQTSRPEALPSEATHEVLRLRGEVARLHREIEDLANETNAEMRVPSRQKRVLHSSLDDFYASSGIDSNSLPSIKLGGTTNEVLAELGRVGANLLNVEEKYIRAEIFPSVAASTNGSIKTQFWFEDGALISRRDFASWADRSPSWAHQ